MMNAETKERSLIRKLGVPMLSGAVVGFLGAFGIVQLMKSGVLGQLDGSREIAILVALVYTISATAVMIGVVSPGFGARFLNVEDADELREQKAMLGYSAISMLALGLALACVALAAPVGPIPTMAAIVVLAALLALAWFTSRRQSQYMDELMSDLSRGSVSAAFYFLLLGGGLWAVLSHLEFVTGPNPLDWLSMFAAALLIGTFWVCGKRGLLVRRK
ncbi:MAG: hypothetical protein ABJP48_11700 [Erythrobacter sp.]